MNDHYVYETTQLIPEYHSDPTVPGVQLENYTRRTPSEDGTYVTIVTHTERIEKIRQPLTPEEIAQKREEDKMIFKVLGGIGLGFVAFIGWMTYLDSKHPREITHDTAVEETP